jgi:hypothetical protein
LLALRANADTVMFEMGTRFWIRRSCTVFVGALVVITVAQFFKGHDLQYSVTQGVIWSAVATSVFTFARIWQSRRGQQCAICDDTPEPNSNDHAPSA